MIASMTSQDLDGWRIGTLPLLLGGAGCLLALVIVTAYRSRSM